MHHVSFPSLEFARARHSGPSDQVVMQVTTVGLGSVRNWLRAERGGKRCALIFGRDLKGTDTTP